MQIDFIAWSLDRASMHEERDTTIDVCRMLRSYDLKKGRPDLLLNFPILCAKHIYQEKMHDNERRLHEWVRGEQQLENWESRWPI